MANLGFLLRTMLGIIPKASKIEERNRLLQEEFLKLQDYKDSDELKEYQELNDLVNSESFKDTKKQLQNDKAWKESDENQKEQRYQEIKNSNTLKWFYSVKDSNKFDELKRWKLTFEDDFSSNSIDEAKWMNSFFWGKMLLNDRYVLAGDKHFYTDNKNFKLNGSTLKIVTKNEQISGKVWNPKQGFYTQDFNYTSGMLSTAHSFRQKYGRFEAKIKVDNKYPVYQAFWLKGEKILPEIDVLKYNMDKKSLLQTTNLWGNPSDLKQVNKARGKMSCGALTKDFYIYTLDWSPEKITWKINGYEIFSSTSGIPNEALYLILSAGINTDSTPQGLPSGFEVDWVRCYEKID